MDSRAGDRPERGAVTVPEWAAEVVGSLGYPAVFATVSGAHLYGFASVDSDLDLRGAHALPLAELVGLRTGPETLQAGGVRDGVELDVVTHELAKFCRLLLTRNGYVLEQLLSPLVVHTTEEHRELAALAPGVVTSHHAHHYRGFANTQWRLFTKTDELKPLLYTFRVLLTGIHLMRSGEVQAHLPTLLGEVGEAPGYLPELVAAKAEREHGAAEVAYARVEADVERLHGLLDEAQAASALPEAPTVYDALHDLVVRVRLER